MFLAIGIETSLEFWRLVYPVDRTPSNPQPLPKGDAAHNEKDVWNLAPTWVEQRTLEATHGMLSVLSFDASSQRRSRTHVSHRWTGPLPTGSFYQLNEHVFVASPEFVFLNAAHCLDIVSLIALGDELCGLYSFDRRVERGIRMRAKPITSSEKLKQFIALAEGCRGCKAARKALPHIVDRSASPMETFDQMTMCLPYRLGGYSLTHPLMNSPVHLSSNAARIAGRGTCVADMLWMAAMLDVEHHGKHDHSTEERALSDRARVNGLKEMGYEVIELTAAQVNNLETYELIVLRIAKLIGKRIRPDQLGATKARLALRRTLRHWNESHGSIL